MTTARPAHDTVITKGGNGVATIRLTTGQAVINYLAVQHVERDGVELRRIANRHHAFLKQQAQHVGGGN